MTNPRGMRRAIPAVAALGLLALTAAVYLPTGDFGYVSYDDPEYVVKSALVRGGLGLSGVGAAFARVHHGNWHPLTTLSYMLEAEDAGTDLDPGLQHRVNVALHLLGALLLFLFLRRATGAPWRCLAVSALFALHPLQVESVAWIAQRKNVLSTFFAFASALAYVGYVHAPGVGRYAAAYALFAAGLFSKAMLVTWPFVLLLLDSWPLRRIEPGQGGWPGSLRRVLVEKAPMLVLSVAVSGITLWAQHEGGALRSTDLVPLGARIANALVAYVAYLRMAVWPTGLAVLYPYPDGLPIAAAVGSAAILIAITALCVWQRRARPYLLVGWLWYLGTLVPVIGLVQVGAQSHADRYSYVPLVGIFVAVVWSAGDLVAARAWLRPVAAAAMVGVLGTLALLSARQVAVWKDSVTLYRHALEVTEGNPIMHNNLGIALVDQDRVDEAIGVYAAGLRLPSQIPHVLHYNAGIALAMRGRYTDALAAFEQVLRADPGHAEALYHRGRTLRALGRLGEARRDLERVVALAPGEADPLVELGLTLGQLGELDPARRRFEQALEIQPAHLDARINLAIAWLKSGDAAAAAAELERVLERSPGHPAALRYLEAARADRAAH